MRELNQPNKNNGCEMAPLSYRPRPADRGTIYEMNDELKKA